LPFVDVLVSLYTVLLGADEPEEQERRLLKQIAPILEALRTPPKLAAPTDQKASLSGR